ncbi:MAG: alpha/beta hydrolase [Parvibaculum sp.]|uniref:alpha/beta hydrolase n=1 Tax=Parvibaculum sp. TaxID=2024848 RepID=UPI003C72A5DE
MNVQKLIVRTLLKLPDGALLAMTGGAPLQIDGRVLDARMQFLAAQGAKAPSITTLDPVAGRAATAQGLALLDGKRHSHVTVKDITIPGAEGPLDARLYTPKNATGPLPGLVFFHFGGCVIGDLDTCDTFCSMLSHIADCVVMSVAYRLAPEHKFPAAADDALAAFRYACANNTALGMTRRIGVGGDSAGGYLSAIVAQETMRAGEETPVTQLLIYPVTDMEWQGGSWTSCENVYPLTRDIMEWFIAQYLRAPADAADLRASPLKATDLEGQPQAIVITSGFDVLRDQGIAYADRLKEAGVKVTYRCYDNLAHAFTAMTGAVPAAKRACEEIARDLHSALRG